jgi:hypothetical protein
MAARGLVGRVDEQGQVNASVTIEGVRRMALARPAHLAAVQRWLIDPLADPAALRAALDALRGTQRT